MTAHLTSHRLDVPGAQLYYEVRGSGPLLLTIAQPMSSGAFGPLADALAEDHTVVTYDPRGLAQSTVQDPTLPVTPEVEADDLARIIEAVGGGPADVFGNSGGAVAGLALVVRHPDRVRTLIAHEPPVTELLPDAPHIRAAVDDVESAYRAAGSGAGWGKFVSLVVHSGPVTDAGVPAVSWPPPGARDASSEADGGGADPADQPAAPEDHAPPEPSSKQRADDALFFLRMLKPFTRYEPDIDALRSAGPQVVIGVGAASSEEIAPRATRALAERLGTRAASFPGDHAGFLGNPAPFADAIRRVLAEVDSSTSV